MLKNLPSLDTCNMHQVSVKAKTCTWTANGLLNLAQRYKIQHYRDPFDIINQKNSVNVKMSAIFLRARLQRRLQHPGTVRLRIMTLQQLDAAQVFRCFSTHFQVK